MKFAADENFNGVLLKGIMARLPHLDLIRVQDTNMEGKPDPELLEWLANEDRILLTHDIQTIPKFVYQRIKAGLSVPGIIEVKLSGAPTQTLLDDLETLMGAGTRADFTNLIRYIPL